MQRIEDRSLFGWAWKAADIALECVADLEGAGADYLPTDRNPG